MYNYITENLAVEEILVYLRKSRSDDPLLTVEEVLQKHENILDEWSEKHLNGKVSEENKYREIVSGETIADRPQMQEILKKIESPKVKAILTVEVQRLSRGDLEDAGRLIKLLRYTNTLVITPQKTYNLQDEYDRDIFERELKRGNEFLEYQKKIMSRGVLESVKSGNFVGSIPPYGYNKIFINDGKRKCPTLEINEEQANAVKIIFDMYVNEDKGPHLIAHKLDELGIKPIHLDTWSPHTIKEILNNIHYIGKVRWNWRKTETIVEEGEIKKIRPKSQIDEYLVFEGKHEAIITEELFYAALAKKGRNHRAKPTTKLRNPLAGLVYCQCGRAMSLRTYKKNGIERAEPRLSCDGQVKCKTGSCLYSEIIEEVENVLKECIEDFEVRINNDNSTSIKLHETLIKNLEKKLKELNQLEISQWEKYSKENMPKHIFDNLNEKVLKEKESVLEALCKAKDSMPDKVDYEEKLVRFKEALETLKDETKPAELKNRLIKSCIERIDYNRKAPERTKSKKVYCYDKEAKRSRTKSSLKVGGNWVTFPMELKFTLRA